MRIGTTRAIVHLVAIAALSCGARVDRRIAADPRIVQVTAGSGHACARRGDGGIVCWGHNFHGQAGGTECLADFDCVTMPHAIEGIRAAQVVAANDATCALVEGGNLWCWGDDPVVACTAAGCERQPHELTDVGPVRAFDLADRHLAVIRADGTTAAWTADTRRRHDGTVPARGEAVAVSAASDSACFTFARGTTTCFGHRATDLAREWDFPIRAISLEAKNDGECAIAVDARLYCQGYLFTDPGSEFDPVDGAIANAPIIWADDALAVSIANWSIFFGNFARYQLRSRGCMVTRAHRVRCWDYDGPVTDVRDATDAIGVAVAPGFACYVRGGGTVWCWGHGGAAAGAAPAPVALPP
jgi:hypothetical protein